MSDADPLSWDTKRQADWIPTVDSWPWTERDTDEWTKSGYCSRCRHRMEVLAESPVVLGARASTSRTSGVVAYAECNCSHEHPGRPCESTRGCGQRGPVAGPP